MKSEPLILRRMLARTVIATIGSVFLVAGSMGLLWSLFMGTLIVLSKSLGPHGFNALAAAICFSIGGVALAIGILLARTGRSMRASAG